jgi:hypothetical protein
MNTFKITGLGTPTISTDAVTKLYVDSIGSGISLATGKATFIALDGSQTNLITAPIPMNN